MTHIDHAAVVREVRERLHTRRLGRVIRSYDVVSSTNELALAWAAENAPEGAMVYAEYQERGRGRMGRPWTARAGLNLTFSVILRPLLPPDRLGMVTIAAGVAVAETVDRFADPIRAELKWPNDVLLDRLKCCGMLLESSWRPSPEQRAVVLGIGVNVNQDEFPPELEDRATSILLATGRTVSRADLLAGLLDRLEKALDGLPAEEEDLRRRFMARMRDLNASVELRFTERGGTVRGVAAGLHESGGLLLATDDGMRTYHAGEVTRTG